MPTMQIPISYVTIGWSYIKNFIKERWFINLDINNTFIAPYIPKFKKVTP
jgi:hypothetical protein